MATISTLFTRLISPSSHWPTQVTVSLQSQGSAQQSHEPSCSSNPQDQQGPTGQGTEINAILFKTHTRPLFFPLNTKTKRKTERKPHPQTKTQLVHLILEKKITRERRKIFSGITQSSNQGISKNTIWKNRQPQLAPEGYKFHQCRNKPNSMFLEHPTEG